jgi:hypothetical protein
MVAAMGNGRCHNGRQQQRQHNPVGHQWWWCNGWQDGSNSAMAIAMNSGGRKEGNGNSNKGGRQAMTTVTKRAMATSMRVTGNKESNGNGGKSDGDNDEGGGQSTATRAMATRVTAEQQRQGHWQW